MEETTKLKYCLYARKSTESEERQVMSIDSQIKEMLQLAERDGLEIVSMKRESHSAKETGRRPVFNEIVSEIYDGKYNSILTWAPDRISRNAGDLGKIVDLMDAGKLCEIKTFSQTFTNNLNEKFLLMILGSQAKLENDNRGINVKRCLRTRCEIGLWPGVAPVGYLNQKQMDQKCRVIIDEKRARVVRQMFEKMGNDKWSGRKIYHWLRFELNFRTHAGKKHLSLGNIYKILSNHFYYGTFEYPKNSGQWYQGKHEPIITKGLFDEVQRQLKGNELKTRRDKEFAFTKLMTCGLCGSGISADEKYKKLKNGSFNTHIYYGCTKAKDKNCKCGYINENDLIKQLQDLIDKVELKGNKVLKQLKSEVTRFKKFQLALKGKSANIKVSDKDVRGYVKFILQDGSVNEKRETLSFLESQVTLRKKKLSITSKKQVL